MNTFTKLALTTAVVAAGGIAMAASDEQTTTEIPEVAKAMVQQLEADGYAIEEVELEDGEVEIEATKDGQEREITLAMDTGEVISDEVEKDDD